MYPVTWKHATKDAVLSLYDANGSPFPFKPGKTWFEVIGASSTVESKAAGDWHFTFHLVP
jgi:hypothetical protein